MALQRLEGQPTTIEQSIDEQPSLLIDGYQIVEHPIRDVVKSQQEGIGEIFLGPIESRPRDGRYLKYQSDRMEPVEATAHGVNKDKVLHALSQVGYRIIDATNPRHIVGVRPKTLPTH